MRWGRLFFWFLVLLLGRPARAVLICSVQSTAASHYTRVHAQLDEVDAPRNALSLCHDKNAFGFLCSKCQNGFFLVSSTSQTCRACPDVSDGTARLFFAAIYLGFTLAWIPLMRHLSRCLVALYRFYIGITDGMSIARVWACRYSK